MNAPRYITTTKFHLGLGWVSEILDTVGAKRILIAGLDHEKRAQARADSLNRDEAERIDARA